jgi:hypothetical protein
VYRRINGGKETLGMRYMRRDKRGDAEGRNREERQREKKEGVTGGRDRRRKGGKETKEKRQRGNMEGEKPDVRDKGHIDTGQDT